MENEKYVSGRIMFLLHSTIRLTRYIYSRRLILSRKNNREEDKNIAAKILSLE